MQFMYIMTLNIHQQKVSDSVKKTSVLNRFNLKKSSEELTSLKLIKNNQNYQIWLWINRIIKTFLFTVLSYNARKKGVWKL